MSFCSGGVLPPPRRGCRGHVSVEGPFSGTVVRSSVPSAPSGGEEAFAPSVSVSVSGRCAPLHPQLWSPTASPLVASFVVSFVEGSFVSGDLGLPPSSKELFQSARWFRLEVRLQFLVSDVHGRTFGVWTLLTCTLCFLCAFNLENKPLYVATFLSFIYAFGHFLTEYLIYNTMVAANLTTVGFFADQTHAKPDTPSASLTHAVHEMFSDLQINLAGS
ncbi:hypothetical protein Taro_040693 [Colocasia esculenta]|uniref:Ergosterol biosynthetic protein 28 n=1 Tax=Colocasia esculenta TaxID=4460 RepID=A0A843W9L3_COLES|nr:hypothetical protein [Colocasia esculenta]